MNDYHIHLSIDECAQPEMTFANIETVGRDIGLTEICVLKHYSLYLPNARSSWIFWKRINKESFESFIKELSEQKKHFSIKLLGGVETELVDSHGTINIPKEDADKVDVVVLSAHWLPRLDVITAHPSLDPYHPNKTNPPILEHWQEEVKKVGAKTILENFIKAYVEAIEKNEKLSVLGHIDDGMSLLRKYQIPVDEIPEKTLCEIFTPLFKICREKGVLWELSAADELPHPELLACANQLGVKFCATADSHSLADLRKHKKAEELIDKYGLKRGSLKIA